MKTKWMLHPETNMVMAFQKQMVEEYGYRPYNGPLPVIDSEKGFRVMHDDVEFETEQSVVEREKTEKAQITFNKHKAKLFEIMKELPPISFVTANGMPKLKLLEKEAGFAPTLDERKEAFDLFMAWKNSDEAKDVPSSTEEV